MPRNTSSEAVFLVFFRHQIHSRTAGMGGRGGGCGELSHTQSPAVVSKKNSPLHETRVIATVSEGELCVRRMPSANTEKFKT